MKHYLLVHSRESRNTVTLPVSGTVHEVYSAEDAGFWISPITPEGLPAF